MAVYIDGYEIDAFVREEHSKENAVTDHEVERGADITDHVRSKHPTVTLESVVSDTPLGDLANRRAGDVPPSQEALARLEAIDEARQPVTVITTLRTYTDMILESLSIPKDAKTGKALRFTARFRRIRIAEVDTAARVDIPRGKAKSNRGNKPSVTIGDAQIEGPPEKRKSLLKRAVNKAGEVF